MATEARIKIIGIGDDGLEGLTSTARSLLDAADLVVGSESLLAGLPGSTESIAVGGDLDELLTLIQQHRDRQLVLLSTGDPLFYGVARFLCDKLGKDQFDVIPHVSSMQLAFARVKESWDDAFLVNVATQSLDRIVEKARLAEKVGLFTNDEVTPRHVAQALLDAEIDYFFAYVCENLGSPDECVTHGSLVDVSQQEFGLLNVMVLVRKPMVPDRPAEFAGQRLFGNPDEMFLQSVPKRGLLTPMEVRVVALAEMDLGPASIVWDVGAGSGAVAIEAARIVTEGHVYAIEMDPQDHQLLTANAERFEVGDSLQPVLGQAPDAWESLPDPDAIFVGGTGRSVGNIVQLAAQRLKVGGRMVVNVGSVDNILAVQQSLEALDGDMAVRMIQISQGNDQLGRIRFETMNPTFLISFSRE
ncbi:MAG: cobalamin biosynthesis bifunctional protein CbiET [Planctomycetaceae bacterium]|nr:cobalamin biosynthesis bifunctional protein CbiET [Planctomycetaceae bacterium]